MSQYKEIIDDVTRRLDMLLQAHAAINAGASQAAKRHIGGEAEVLRIVGVREQK